jgi:phospholipid-translocating ATPase
MALPELYRPGREGKWFGLGIFALYMIDAVYQSAVIFFLTTYSYQSISGRSDGYSVDNVESSTVSTSDLVLVRFISTSLRLWL